ncbi:hypothetical protein AT469_10000 [Klebsiella pneumoniae]|nr:hypothetical protein AT470_21250 [Klebsiella pneumoniae]KSU97922.1 hypothetical protein AT473_16430 [Klebsiella pneumoniae]KSV03886.1 hypothetical protein AT471_03065 [Klebsiella pneumoniae]KSV08209.1 hypothetical protein AT472_15365 [Klebsiella pneumoniae]KSV14167.1 hypothetical protein AT469_10000 [Klebsiella pneumoniae]
MPGQDERNLSDINTFFAGQYSKVSVRRGSCRNKVFAEKKQGREGNAEQPGDAYRRRTGRV